MGEIGDEGRSRGLELHQTQQVRGALPGGGRLDSVDVGDEGEGLLGREAVEQRKLLRHDTCSSFDGDAIGHRIQAEDAHGAGRRLEQPRQATEGRGLAGAVRSEESVEAPGGHLEVHARHGTNAAEIAGELPCLDGKLHQGSSIFSSAAVNCGTSSGFLEVIRFPSCTTGRST